VFHEAIQKTKVARFYGPQCIMMQVNTVVCCCSMLLQTLALWRSSSKLPQQWYFFINTLLC